MNIIFDLGALLSGVALLLVGWSIKLAYGITDHLNILNGRTAKMETWQVSHDKQDDEWHAEGREEFAELKDAITRLEDRR